MTEKAKGVMLYSRHVPADGSVLSIPEGIDFIVAVAMVDMEEERGFNSHVQAAYNAGIPCIALVDVDISVYSDAFSLATPKWEDVDHLYTDILDKLFLTPDRSRTYAFQAVMLDIRTADNRHSGAWIVATARHLRDLVKRRYFDKPVYFLTNQSVLTYYPDSGTDPQVWLSQQPMLCTVSFTDAPVPNWQGIKFWWHRNDYYTFTSMLTPLFEYESDVAHLRADLGLTAPTPPEESTPPEPEDDVIVFELGKVYKIMFK